MAQNPLGQTIPRRSPQRRRHHKLPRVRETLRVISNVGLIIGQCILLFASRDVGLVVIILSSLLSFPFFYKEKMVDVLVLMAFMFIVNVTGLVVK